MNDECRDVEEDEHACDGPGADLEHPVLALGEEEVYHSSQEHVDVGVDPERREQDQQQLSCIDAAGTLVLYRKCAGHVATCLPESAHHKHSSKGLAVDDCLDDVCAGRKAE